MTHPPIRETTATVLSISDSWTLTARDTRKWLPLLLLKPLQSYSFIKFTKKRSFFVSKRSSLQHCSKFRKEHPSRRLIAKVFFQAMVRTWSNYLGLDVLKFFFVTDDEGK